MMYSYVVSTTWKLFVRSSVCSTLRCVGLPLYEIIFTLGAHFANSPDQFVIVESGTITRYGPRCRFVSIRNVTSEIVWIVFPRPYHATMSTTPYAITDPTHHLIGKDSVQLVVVQTDHPLQTLELVLLQCSHQHLGLLNGELAAQRRRVLEVKLVRIDCNIR